MAKSDSIGAGLGTGVVLTATPPQELPGKPSSLTDAMFGADTGKSPLMWPHGPAP